MNNKISIIGKIIVMMCFVTFSSCKDDETTTLTVSKDLFEIDKAGVTENGSAIAFKVNSNKDWTLTCSSWLTPTKTSGGAGETDVTVSAAAADAARDGNITVKAGDQTVVITVRQMIEIVASTLEVTPKNLTIAFDGKIDSNSPKITITTNKSWTVSGLPLWITAASPASGNAGTSVEITLTVSTNTGADELNDSFTINAGILSETVTVKQLAEDIEFTVSTDEIEVDADGGSPTITITSNRAWSIPTHPSWITPSQTQGEAGETTVTLIIDPYESETGRFDDFAIHAGYRSESVIVRQKPVEFTFTFTTTSIEVDADGKISGNSPTFTFSSTKAWEITELPQWITAVSPSSGIAGNHTVTLTVDAYDLPRKSNFKLTADDGYSEFITVEINKNMTSFPMNFSDPIALTITERDGYLEFIMLDRNPDLYDPYVFGTIQGVASGAANLVLTFDYQIDYDPADVWEGGAMAALYDTGGAIFAWRAFPAYKITGIDPSNNALWETYRVTFESYTGSVRFNFRIAEARLLMKNVRVVAL